MWGKKKAKKKKEKQVGKSVTLPSAGVIVSAERLQETWPGLCVGDLRTGSRSDPSRGTDREGLPGHVEATHPPRPLLRAGSI